jgi:hypothetical protein
MVALLQKAAAADCCLAAVLLLNAYMGRQCVIQGGLKASAMRPDPNVEPNSSNGPSPDDCDACRYQQLAQSSLHRVYRRSRRHSSVHLPQHTNDLTYFAAMLDQRAETILFHALKLCRTAWRAHTKMMLANHTTAGPCSTSGRCVASRPFQGSTRAPRPSFKVPEWTSTSLLSAPWFWVVLGFADLPGCSPHHLPVTTGCLFL